MTTERLTCSDLIELVTMYLDGALSATDRQAFDEHVQQCPRCRRYLEQMRRTVQLTGRLREDDVPAAAWGVLLRAFRQQRRPPDPAGPAEHHHVRRPATGGDHAATE